MPLPNAAVTTGEKLFWILVYSVCSSTMLVLNKLAVQELPLPTIVSGAQLSFSVVVVLVMQMFDSSTMGPMDKKKVVPFAFYTALFSAGLYSNIKALMLTNVGSIIAARSCLPVIVCLIEWAFLGRALPGVRPTLSLLGVVFFAGLYIRTDAGLAVQGMSGYVWIFIWWVLIALQMTYGKWLTEMIEMTQWERVFYTNMFALPPTIALFFGTGEMRKTREVVFGPSWQIFLVMSCIMGVGISYTGWRTRSVITATTFALVGVLNKVATISFMVIVWPTASSLVSIVSLMCCILCGLLYKEVPKMKETNKKDAAVTSGDQRKEAALVEQRGRDDL